MTKINPFDPHPLTPPSTPEFYAVFRTDTREVLWFEIQEEDAEAKATAFSLLPEYKDVPISWHLCKHPDIGDNDGA